MKKSVFLICFLLLWLTCCFEDCLTTPDKPDPKPEEKVEYHSYWVEYRVKPEWLKPDCNCSYSSQTAYLIISTDSGKTYRIQMGKVNDYLFIGELNAVECRKSFDSRTFDWFITDDRRNSLSSKERISFGDIFILEEKETRVRTELTYVIPNNNYHPDGRHPDAKMARCWILHDGSVVISQPQQSQQSIF